MRAVQIIGWLLLLFMGMFGVYEVVQHFRHGGWALTDVGQFWTRLHPPSLNAIGSFFQSSISPGFWNWFVRQPVLTISGFLALFCMLISYAAQRSSSSR
jgi:hypothetical protein